MQNKFSLRVQQVIQYSREEALRLGHDFIGTEHLLLGIIRLGDGLAAGVTGRDPSFEDIGAGEK